MDYTEGSTTPTTAAPTQHPPTTTPYTPSPHLSPLETDVLNEYARLRNNLDILATHLAGLSSTPSSAIADGLRLLERKTSLVCTALKASVYGIVLAQQIEYADGEGEADGGR